MFTDWAINGYLESRRPRLSHSLNRPSVWSTSCLFEINLHSELQPAHGTKTKGANCLTWAQVVNALARFVGHVHRFTLFSPHLTPEGLCKTPQKGWHSSFIGLPLLYLSPIKCCTYTGMSRLRGRESPAHGGETLHLLTSWMDLCVNNTCWDCVGKVSQFVCLGYVLLFLSKGEWWWVGGWVCVGG